MDFDSSDQAAAWDRVEADDERLCDHQPEQYIPAWPLESKYDAPLVGHFWRCAICHEPLYEVPT